MASNTAAHPMEWGSLLARIRTRSSTSARTHNFRICSLTISLTTAFSFTNQARAKAKIKGPTLSGILKSKPSRITGRCTRIRQPTLVLSSKDSLRGAITINSRRANSSLTIDQALPQAKASVQPPPKVQAPNQPLTSRQASPAAPPAKPTSFLKTA